MNHEIETSMPQSDAMKNAETIYSNVVPGLKITCANGIPKLAKPFLTPNLLKQVSNTSGKAAEEEPVDNARIKFGIIFFQISSGDTLSLIPVITKSATKVTMQAIAVITTNIYVDESCEKSLSTKIFTKLPKTKIGINFAITDIII